MAHKCIYRGPGSKGGGLIHGPSKKNMDSKFPQYIFSSDFELSAQAELMYGVDGIHPFIYPTGNFGPDKSARLHLQISFYGQ